MGLTCLTIGPLRTGRVGSATRGTRPWPLYKVGELYPVWWDTGRKVNGRNMATIYAVELYKGRYTDSFMYTLTLEALHTKGGRLKMAVEE